MLPVEPRYIWSSRTDWEARATSMASWSIVLVGSSRSLLELPFKNELNLNFCHVYLEENNAGRRLLPPWKACRSPCLFCYESELLFCHTVKSTSHCSETYALTETTKYIVLTCVCIGWKSAPAVHQFPFCDCTLLVCQVGLLPAVKFQFFNTYIATSFKHRASSDFSTL